MKIVMDNLNTHKEKSFYEAFSEDEAERILDKIEFHYTPKHASWLNAAEIEINVMDIECTDRRIADMELLAYEVAAWTRGGMTMRIRLTGSLRVKMLTRNYLSMMSKN
jgi:hypothetical protein